MSFLGHSGNNEGMKGRRIDLLQLESSLEIPLEFNGQLIDQQGVNGVWMRPKF